MTAQRCGRSKELLVQSTNSRFSCPQWWCVCSSPSEVNVTEDRVQNSAQVMHFSRTQEPRRQNTKFEDDDFPVRVIGDDQSEIDVEVDNYPRRSSTLDLGHLAM